MSTLKPNPHRLSPALRSFLIAFVALLTYAVLWGAGRWSGADSHIPAGYPLWAAAATVSFVIWLVVFLSGVDRVRSGPDQPSKDWWRRSIVVYTGLAIVASGLLIWITSAMAMSTAEGEDAWTVPAAFRVIIILLTAVGWAAAAPWIMLAWITHEELGALDGEVDEIQSPAPADDFDPRELDGVRLNDIARRMKLAWDGIEGPSLALGLLLSTLVLNTGTLRLVELDAGRDPATFPPFHVLAYGAFFALVTVAIVGPLVLEWRRRGLDVITAALPEPRSGVPSESQVAAAGRLAGRLGLDAPLLRRPITALGVLAPFVTAIVASLVPTG